MKETQGALPLILDDPGQSELLPSMNDDMTREERLSGLVRAMSTIKSIEAANRFLADDRSILFATGRSATALLAEYAPARFLLSQEFSAKLRCSRTAQEAIIERDDTPPFLRSMAVSGYLEQFARGSDNGTVMPRVDADETLATIVTRGDLASNTSIGRKLLSLASGSWFTSFTPAYLDRNTMLARQRWAADLLVRSPASEDGDLATIVYECASPEVHLAAATHPNAGIKTYRAVAYQSGADAVAVVARIPALFSGAHGYDILAERVSGLRGNRSSDDVAGALLSVVTDESAETRRECLMVLLDQGAGTAWQLCGEDSPRGAYCRSLLTQDDLKRFISSSNPLLRTQAILIAPLLTACHSAQPKSAMPDRGRAGMCRA